MSDEMNAAKPVGCSITSVTRKLSPNPALSAAMAMAVFRPPYVSIRPMPRALSPDQTRPPAMSSTFSTGRLRPCATRFVNVVYTLSTPRMIEALSAGVRGEVMPMPAEVLLFTASNVMPSLFFRASMVLRYMPKTPMEPVRVSLSATMTSAGHEI